MLSNKIEKLFKTNFSEKNVAKKYRIMCVRKITTFTIDKENDWMEKYHV